MGFPPNDPRGVSRALADGRLAFFEPEAGGQVRRERHALTSGGRSPLIDLFPEARNVDAFFTVAAIQADFTVPSGYSAWFGLQDVRVDEDTGQEVAITQLRAHAMPTDPNADGGESSGTTPVVWGSAYGTGAALVVGINLPIVFGEWTAAPAVLAGLETGSSLTSERGLSRYIWSSKFPAGTLDGTNKVEEIDNKSWTPAQWRVPAGNRLGVALVVRGSQITGNGGKHVCGFGHVQVTLANTIITAGFTGN